MNRNKRLISEIGKELRRIRQSQGKTMQDIANESDVSSMYISEIERNMKVPSDELIDKLSNLYKVNNIDMYEGFNKLPERVEKEVMSNSILFEILYKLTHITDNDAKEEFYLKMKSEYDKIFQQ